MFNTGDNIGYLLNKAARLMKSRVNQRLAEIGLTFPQFLVIRHLYDQEVSEAGALIITPALIAERLGYDRPTMTGILDRLVKQGFVTRETHPEDRRSQRISLTGKARELMETMNVFCSEVNDQAMTGFGEDEYHTFKKCLVRVMKNFGE
jgi:MarR family transcriptional regulator for hemolysin